LKGSITYVCHEGFGGVADRVRGIGAMYMFAVLKNRTLHIRTPYMHLLPHNVRWDTPSNPTAHFSAIDRIDGLSPCKWWPENVSVSTNQWVLAMATEAECFYNDTRIQSLARAFVKASVGARDYVLAYPCIGQIFQRLFKPTRSLADAVRVTVQRRGVVGIHIRDGDSAMIDGGQPRPTVSLAPCLAAARAWRLPTIYVVSDSPAIKREAALAGIIVSQQQPFHVNRQTYDANLVMGVMVDLLTLASLDAIVLTSSGFGALAALISGYRPENIAYCWGACLFRPVKKECVMELKTQTRKAVFCIAVIILILWSIQNANARDYEKNTLVWNDVKEKWNVHVLPISSSTNPKEHALQTCLQERWIYVIGDSAARYFMHALLLLLHHQCPESEFTRQLLFDGRKTPGVVSDYVSFTTPQGCKQLEEVIKNKCGCLREYFDRQYA
jgi:hypothetical protein